LPWTELIGVVDRVDNEVITLKVEYEVRISADELAEWAPKLRRGSRIGVLFMDDGVRVRVLDEGSAGGEDEGGGAVGAGREGDGVKETSRVPTSPGRGGLLSQKEKGGKRDGVWFRDEGF